MMNIWVEYILWNRSKNMKLFKLLIAGSGGSGKTTMIQRYTTGIFNESTQLTIGVDFCVATIKTQNESCRMQIWDFGGEQRFRVFLPSYCVGASGCLLLFDPLQYNSFLELIEWITIIRNNTKNIPILLISTKQDLLETNHVEPISQNDIDNFIADHNLNGFLRISSKTGLNVKNAFIMIAEMIIQQKKDELPLIS